MLSFKTYVSELLVSMDCCPQCFLRMVHFLHSTGCSTGCGSCIKLILKTICSMVSAYTEPWNCSLAGMMKVRSCTDIPFFVLLDKFRLRTGFYFFKVRGGTLYFSIHSRVRDSGTISFCYSVAISIYWMMK